MQPTENLVYKNCTEPLKAFTSNKGQTANTSIQPPHLFPDTAVTWGNEWVVHSGRSKRELDTHLNNSTWFYLITLFLLCWKLNPGC